MRNKFLCTIISWLICIIAYGQDAPPSGATLVSPTFTWYKKIADGDTSYFGYSNNNWVNFARKNWVKKFVADNLLTASNGLTRVENDVQLGGIFNQDVQVTSNQGKYFSIGTGKPSTSRSARVDLGFDENNNAFFKAYNGDVSNAAPYNLEINTGTGLSIGRYLDFAGNVYINQRIAMNVHGANGQMTVYDEGANIFGKGLVNGGDYEANFVPRSLVTKRYVDSVSSTVNSNYIQNQNTILQYAYSWILGAKYGFENDNQANISPLAISFDNQYITTIIGSNGYGVTENATGDQRFSLIPDHDTTRISGSKSIVFKTKLKSEFTPVDLLDVANKKYVDSLHINFANSATVTYLPKSGGTMTGDLILSSATPTNALSAAPKAYIDNLITGITWKNAVRVKTTTNIILSGTQTIDGVSLAVGNRVLVNNQSDQTKNGIYIVASGTWARAADVDDSTEINTSTVAVTSGTLGKNTQWTYIGIPAPAIGSDNIVFGQISGAGTYANGTYLTLSGNVFDANLTAFDTRYLRSSGGNTINGYQHYTNTAQVDGDFGVSSSIYYSGITENTSNVADQVLMTQSSDVNKRVVYRNINNLGFAKLNSGNYFSLAQEFAGGYNVSDGQAAIYRNGSFLDFKYPSSTFAQGDWKFGANGSTSDFRLNRVGYATVGGVSVPDVGFDFKTDGLYRNNVRLLETGDVPTQIINDGRYLQLTGGTLTGTLNGAAAYFTGSLGAQTIGLSSYTDALIPGQIAAGNEIKMGTINNGPFAGLSTYVNGVAEYRAGRAPGGTSYTIGQNVSGSWVSYLDANSTGVNLPKGFTSNAASGVNKNSNDAVAALIVNQQQGTGNIQNWQCAGSTVSSVNPLGQHMVDSKAIGTTFAPAINLINSTAATSSVPNQYSGGLQLTSSVWNSTTTSANSMQWKMDSRTAGAASPRSDIWFGFNNNGAGFADLAVLDGLGYFATTSGFRNMANSNNGVMALNATGLNFYRNVNDANTAFTINNVQGTGNIQNWQFNNSSVAFLNNTGQIGATSIGNFSNLSNANISFATTGMIASRNVADAVPAMTINNLSGTGDIFRVQQSGANRFTVDLNGNAVTTGNSYASGRIGIGITTSAGALLHINPGTFTTSGSFGTSGFGINQVATTYTSTGSSGTIPAAFINYFGNSVLAAPSAINITKAYGSYFGQPTGSANVTLGNSYSLGTSGDVEIGGNLFVTARQSVGKNTVAGAVLDVDQTAGFATINPFSSLGFGFRLGASITTYTSNAAAGTQSFGTTASIAGGIYAAANATTIANGAALYISAPPTAGANVAITNRWSLYVNSGDNYFGNAIVQGTANTYSTGGILHVGRNITTGRIETLPDMIAFNATTTGLSSAALNSTYPTAPLGFQVICGNISAGGAIYTKYASSAWLVSNATIQP